MVVTGMMFANDMTSTRATVPAWDFRVEAIGVRALRGAADSTVLSRARIPIRVTINDARKGIRHPHDTKASWGISAVSGMKTSAATICPNCAPCRVAEALTPLCPTGACSTMSVEEPEISPATANPWIRRHVTSRIGAVIPTCS